MSCPRERELLQRQQHGALDADLTAHAQTCRDCSEALQLLGGATELLAAPRLPELTPEARARMWRTIEAAGPRPFWARFDLRFTALATVAASAIAIVYLSTRPVSRELILESGELTQLQGAQTITQGTELAAGAPYRAGRPALISGPGLEIDAHPGAVLHFETLELQQSIVVNLGELDLRVAPLETGSAVAILTPAARIEVIGTRLSVAVLSDATRVAVEHGRVRVEPHVASLAAFELTAGEHRLIPNPIDPEQLAREADRLRRAGNLREAATMYATLAADPRGAGYAEEAMLRRARILAELEQIDEALIVLTRAGDRFPGGVLGPERAALRAELLASRGSLIEAADVMATIDRQLSSEAIEQKKKELIEKIRAQMSTDPKRAEELSRALRRLER